MPVATNPAGLTAESAHELGKAVRFIRMSKDMSLRDIAKAGGLSPQYLQNIEQGVRLQASDDAYRKIARGLGVEEEVLMQLVYKARILSVMEKWGLSDEQRDFVWRGIEQRLHEIGQVMRTPLEDLVPDMLRVGNDGHR